MHNPAEFLLIAAGEDVQHTECGSVGLMTGSSGRLCNEPNVSRPRELSGC